MSTDTLTFSQLLGPEQELLFQPPFHPLLQATEDIWGFVKNYVRHNRKDFTKEEVERRVEEGFRDAERRGFWSDAVRHCREEEERLWKKLENVPFTVLPTSSIAPPPPPPAHPNENE